MHKVQLFRVADVGIEWCLPYLPKKNDISRSADVVESLPCTQFLVPSVPYRALSELGASLFAT